MTTKDGDHLLLASDPWFIITHLPFFFVFLWGSSYIIDNSGFLEARGLIMMDVSSKEVY